MKKRLLLSILILTVGFSLFSVDFSLSHAEGMYNEDIQLEIFSENELYYGFYNAELTRYESALSLSAVSGEARTYKLSVYDTSGKELAVLTYVIDKAIPLAPEPLVSPGIYHNSFELNFKKTNETIWVSLDGKDFFEYQNPIQIDSNIFISAYCLDAAGNKSLSFSDEYYVDKTGALSEVLSPRSGVFGNPQSLVIESPDIKGYTYILNGLQERSYNGPVLLDSNKNNTIKIYKTDSYGTRIQIEEIHYTYTPDNIQMFYQDNQLRNVLKNEYLDIPIDDDLYINGYLYSETQLQLPVSTGIQEFVVLSSYDQYSNTSSMEGVHYLSVLVLDGVFKEAIITGESVNRPSVRTLDGGVEFSSKDTNLYYRVTSPYSESIWTPYSSPVSVFLPAQMEADFTFELSKNGEVGDIKAVKKIDNLLPGIPRIKAENGRLLLEGPGTLYYSVDNSEFKKYAGSVDLKPFDEKRNTYLIRAYSEQGSRHSSVAVTALVIDNRTPFLPNISLPTFSNQESLQISNINVPKDLEIYVSWTEDGTEPGNPVSGGKTITDFNINMAEGEEKQIHLKLQARYDNGSKVSNIRSFIVFMDRLSPGVPVLKDIQNGEIIGNQLFVQFENHVDQIVYSIDDNTELNVADDNAIPLDKLSGSVSIRYWAVDKALNKSPEQYLDIIIDTERPPMPGINIKNNQGFWNGTTLIITPASGNQVYYELEKDGIIISTGEYRSPVNIGAVANKVSKYTLRSYSMNSSGNKSDINRVMFYTSQIASMNVVPYVLDLEQYKLLHINLPENVSALVNEVEYNGTTVISGDNLSIQIIDGDILWPLMEYNVDDIIIASMKGLPSKGISSTAAQIYIDSSFPVHYQIEKNGGPVREVNLSSPRYRQQLFLDTLPGTESRYSLSLQLFDKNNPVLDTDIVLFFTVDKKAPDTPRFIVNDSPKSGNFIYFSEPVYLGFAGRGTVYYSISDSEYEIFLDDLYIAPEKGQIKKIKIKAYVQDAAGNKSPVITTELFLDNEIIYVSSVNGDDENKGTRETPVKTLKKALEISAIDNRSSIYLTSGQYELNEMIVVNGNTAIYGGFSDIWDYSEAATSVFINTSKGAGFFLENDLMCNNIRLTTSSRSPDNALLEGRGGSLYIEDCYIETAGQVAVSGGDFTEVSIKNSFIENRNPAVKNGLYFQADNINIFNSEIRSTDSVSGYTLLRLEDTPSITIRNSEFYPGFSDQSTAVSLSKSKLDFISSNIYLQGAKKNNTGLDIHNSTAAIDECLITSQVNSQMAQGIFISNSDVAIRKSKISLSGNFGVIGVNVNDSSLLSIENKFEYIDIPGFSYGFSINNGAIISDSDSVLFKDVSDVAGLMSTNSSIELKHFIFSAVAQAKKSGVASGVISSYDKDLFIYSSLFETNQTGSFLGFSGKPDINSIKVQYSQLTGWENMANGDYELKSLSDLNHLINSYSNY